MAITKVQMKALEDRKSRNIKANSKLVIHKNFKPEWLEAGWVAHPLDESDLRALRNKKGHESESLLALMSEEGFDSNNGVVHMYWGSEVRTFKHVLNESLVTSISKISIGGEFLVEHVSRLVRENLDDNEVFSGASLSDGIEYLAGKEGVIHEQFINNLEEAILDRAMLDAVVISMETGKSFKSLLKGVDDEYIYLMKIITHLGFDLDLGCINHEYKGTAIETFWEGVNRRSLDVLRYADPEIVAAKEKTSLFESEIEWIASKQYDAVCRMLSLDSQSIRSFLPDIMKSYGKRLNANCQRLMDAFSRISDSRTDVLEDLERMADFLSDVEAPVGNDTTYDDREKSKQLRKKRMLTSNNVLVRANQKTKRTKNEKMAKAEVNIEDINFELFPNL